MSMGKMAALLAMQAVKQDFLPNAVWNRILPDGDEQIKKKKDKKERKRLRKSSDRCVSSEREEHMDDKHASRRSRSEPGNDRDASDNDGKGPNRRGRRRLPENDDALTGTAPQASADPAGHLSSSLPIPQTQSSQSLLHGYHDGPPPETASSDTHFPYYTTAPPTPQNMASPPPSHYGGAQEGSYYPPREDYSARQGYNPARYQPSEYTQGPRSETLALQGPRSTYSDAQYGGGRPGSDYDSRYDDRYDERDDEEDRHRSRSRRSKSKSRRDRSRESEYGTDLHKGIAGIGDKFDLSAQGAGAAALGAIAGGFLGHKFGKNSPIATGAGALIGGLGANAWENRNRQRHDKDRHRDRDLIAYEGRSRSSDPRSIEYPDRSSRPGSRYGGYDDEYSDEYDDDRSRRRDDRRRRRSAGHSRAGDEGSDFR